MLRGAVVIVALLVFLGIATIVQADPLAPTSVRAARCASRAFAISYDPAGQLKILEYIYPKRDKEPGAIPTGRILGFMDATTANIAPFCSRIMPRPLPAPSRTRALAGPYPRGSVESRVYCMKTYPVWDKDFGRSVQIEMRPLLNRARHPIGMRLIARIDSILVLTATVTRRDGVYSFDHLRCLRNPAF